MDQIKYDLGLLQWALMCQAPVMILESEDAPWLLRLDDIRTMHILNADEGPVLRITWKGTPGGANLLTIKQTAEFFQKLNVIKQTVESQIQAQQSNQARQVLNQMGMNPKKYYNQ